MFKPLQLLYKIICYLFSAIFSCLWSAICKRSRPNFSCDIVLITGGAQGLGRELAVLFSESGATVVIWDINETKLRQTCSEITAQGREAFGYVVDCSKKEQVYETAEKVREEVGNVSVLVNNVGILPGKLITEFKDEEFEKTINVNFVSHYWTVRSFLPWMLKNNYGYIAEIGSFAAFTGGPLVSDYHSSKAALVNFCESLHYELMLTGKSGVKVTCICPWHIRTGLAPSRVMKMVMFIRSLSVSYVAQCIVQAVFDGDYMVHIPKYMGLIALMSFLSPIKLKDILISTYTDRSILKPTDDEEESE